MITDPDLSILLTAQPKFLEDDLDGGKPTLPAFSDNIQQANDPRKKLPIIVTSDSAGGSRGNLFTARTIGFLAPTNGAFGLFQAYIKGEVMEP